jgi:hypothetical protein
MAQKKNNKSGLVLLGLTLFFLSRSRASTTNENLDYSDKPGRIDQAKKDPNLEANLQSAFDALEYQYGSAFAKEIEQLFRKETAHFTSGQFMKTFSPGMEAVKGKNIFPWGWGSLAEFANIYPGAKLNSDTMYVVPMTENNTGLTKYYIGFPDIASAVAFVGYTLKKRLHPGYWRSTKKEIADPYRASYQKIKTEFVV